MPRRRLTHRPVDKRAGMGRFTNGIFGRGRKPIASFLRQGILRHHADNDLVATATPAGSDDCYRRLELTTNGVSLIHREQSDHE